MFFWLFEEWAILLQSGHNCKKGCQTIHEEQTLALCGITWAEGHMKDRSHWDKINGCRKRESSLRQQQERIRQLTENYMQGQQQLAAFNNTRYFLEHFQRLMMGRHASFYQDQLLKAKSQLDWKRARRRRNWLKRQQMLEKQDEEEENKTRKPSPTGS